MAAILSELLGTTLLLLLGDGVVANVVLRGTKGHGAGWIVIACGWAMAVFVGVLCSAAWSGAHLNPAVTLGLALDGRFGWELVPGYILAQLVGAFVGALLVWTCHRDHFALPPAAGTDAAADAESKRAVFCTVPALRNLPRNAFVEAIATSVLVLCVLRAVSASATLDGRAVTVGLGALGALPVALVVLAIGLSLGGTTGYAINPARDLAPRLAHSLLPIPGKGSSDWGYAWVPGLGPLAGAALAVGVHRLLAMAGE